MGNLVIGKQSETVKADISPEIITVTQYADVEKIYEKDCCGNEICGRAMLEEVVFRVFDRVSDWVVV